ncbi:MAG: IS1182 family transposase [Firmicutes bacterium]|nr:IS1182 family transposase [Bacillota bacterium]
MSFIPYQSNPRFVLPPRVGDFIPQDDLCWVTAEVVDMLDLSGIKGKYSDYGTDGYHPGMLLKLIFYGVATGNRSSRKLARLAAFDVRGIMLCGGLRPSWRTINRFISDNYGEVSGLFCQVLKICKELGMVGFGHLTLDGTKVKAAASKKKNMTLDRLEKDLAELKKEIGEALAEIRANDEQETDVELPDGLKDKAKRKAKIERAIAELKARKEEEPDSQATPRYNMTDPDSRLMKTSRNGYQQCYNHQIAVDTENMVITAYGTSQDASDINQMQPVLKASEANTGKKHEAVSADTGYFAGENLDYLKHEGIDGYICPERDAGEYHKSKFSYDEERDLYVCPAGRELTYVETKKKQAGKDVRVYSGDCSGCPHQKACVKSKTGNRQVERDQYDHLREEMREKLQTDRGQEMYGKRKETVEPVIGQIKMHEDFTRHYRKGREAVDAEYGLTCLAHNLKRIWHKFKDCQGVRAALNGLAALEYSR